MPTYRNLLEEVGVVRRLDLLAGVRAALVDMLEPGLHGLREALALMEDGGGGLGQEHGGDDVLHHLVAFS